MNIHFSFDSLPVITNPVVTTGSFDGVHVGHKVIIRRLKKIAKDIGGETVLITFDPHPRRVLYPQTEGKDLLLICNLQEKIYLLERTGLDHLIIIPFTLEFSRISSLQFIEDILLKKMGAKVIVVGFNHHFGHNREGDFEYLYRLSRKSGFEVEEIPEQDIQHETVSSTKIRRALIEGNIQRANAYLDHYYLIRGRCQADLQRSDDFGIGIFSLALPDRIKLIPPDGVYAVNIRRNGQSSRGMLSIEHWGIEEGYLSAETRLGFHPVDEFSCTDEEEVTVYFHKRMRGTSDSKDLAGLRRQLQRDIAAIEELIF
jgi:riboflavin kinase/FMN adenylyltransferase